MFVAALVERLVRRTALTVSVADRHVLVALDGVVMEGDLTKHALA